MPLYEYQCSSCAHRFERIVKFSDPAVRTCPQCGKDALDQMISAPAIQFKGSGWYVTDYSHKNAAASAPLKQDGGSESASAGTDSGNGNGSSSSSEKSGGSEKSADNGSSLPNSAPASAPASSSPASV